MEYRSFQNLLLAENIYGDLKMVDCMIFDVDGVLVDANESYPRAICDAVEHYAAQLLSLKSDQPCRFHREQVPLFKAAGGFNDEWDLAYAAALWITWCHVDSNAPALEHFVHAIASAGGGVDAAIRIVGQQSGARTGNKIHTLCDRDFIHRLAQEYYAGPADCPSLFGFPAQYVTIPGHHRLEQNLASPSLLNPWIGRLGLYTGRNRQETDFVLRRASLEQHFPCARRITTSSGIYKPDPQGLDILLRRIPHQAALFVGDTVDDLRCVQNYRLQYPGAPFLWFAGVTTGAMGLKGPSAFTRQGADILTPSAEALLNALRYSRHSGQA